MTSYKHQEQTLDRYIKNSGKEPEFLTLKQAAKLLNKSVHNISYLIAYKRINKYDSLGRKKAKVGKGGIYVSKSELLQYWDNWQNQLKQRRESLNIKNVELAFYDLSEKERTKHIHRLHPYLGKFIPQLVEHYVVKNFKQSDIILDPFMGSGTTLAVSAELNMRSIGIDVSEFNCTIARAKLENYDIIKVEKEITEIYNSTKQFSDKINTNIEIPKKISSITNHDYLNTWFAPRSLAELLFYKDEIKNYDYQEILQIILTRAARSSRLVHHYDIATPKKPATEPYVCRKHQDKICTPIDRAIDKLKVYSFDTIERLKEFADVRKNNDFLILQGDSRTIDLQKYIQKKWGKNTLVTGIFTSPPYVGQIDYHEQHRYAYELLDIARKDEHEIGAKISGKGKTAQENYKNGISAVFRNVSEAMDSKAKIFIVANDKFNLYSDIVEKGGLKLVDVKERPVEARTEADKSPYSEKIFECRLA